MDWQVLGALSEFIGAVAVVITLIYLAVQLRQNTASVRASAYQTWSDSKIAVYESAQTSDSLPQTIVQGLDDPASLTNDNWIQFAFWCTQHVLAAQTAYFLNKDGVIPESIFDKELLTTAALVLQSKGGSEWWKAGARTQFSSEFVNAIDAVTFETSDMQRYAFTEGKGFHPSV